MPKRSAADQARSASTTNANMLAHTNHLRERDFSRNVGGISEAASGG